MKLAHIDLERAITFEYGKGCEWIIESPTLFSRYVQELREQSEGKEGGFVLSDNDEQLDMQKNAEVIIDPFAIRMDDKRILNKLYGVLEAVLYGEDIYILTQEIASKLHEYILQVEHESPYMLEMNLELNIQAVFKALGVKLDDYADDLCEKLSLYIKTVAELLNKKVVILVNAGSYLEREQIEQLTDMAAYNEIALLLLENQQRGFSSKLLQYIIDIDGCEI